MKRIKVLQILDELHTGGAEQIIVSYFLNSNSIKYEWDFVIMDVPYKGRLEEEVINNRGSVIRVTRKRKNFFFHCIDMVKVIKNGNYDIVHSNLYELSAIYLLIAFLCKVRVRIAHIHSAYEERSLGINLFCRALKPLLKWTANGMVACGEMAARAFWGDKLMERGKVKILRNAIMCDRYRYIDSIRHYYRKQLNLTDETVIGVVARISREKNPFFIIDCFKEFMKLRENSVLVYIGEGELEEKLKQYVADQKLDDKTMFLGKRNDVDKMYNSFDGLLMPSLYEGMPIVGIEAQCNGLPCLFSDRITKEVLINSNVKMLSLEDSPVTWAENLYELVMNSNTNDRNMGYENIVKAGYDLRRLSKELDDYYGLLWDKYGNRT